MAKKSNAEKSKAKSTKQRASALRREKERRSQVLPDIASLLAGDLKMLVPVDEIETVLSGSVDWRLLTSKKEILDWSISKYNHIVTTDIHEHCKHVPKDRHPLHKYFVTHESRHDYAEMVGYIHNQLVIEG